jgi:hypothetical protein
MCEQMLAGAPSVVAKAFGIPESGPRGGCRVDVGRHGAMNPAGRVPKRNLRHLGRLRRGTRRVMAEQAPGLAVTRNRVRKTINEQLKGERPHRGGPQPIETVVDRWELGAFAATTEAARVSVPSADP